MAITNGELDMVDTDIHDNQSDSNSGGVKLVGSTAYITNGRIYDNIARKEGGGIALWDSTIILNGATLERNEGRERGMDLYCHSNTVHMEDDSNVVICMLTPVGVPYQHRETYLSAIKM